MVEGGGKGKVAAGWDAILLDLAAAFASEENGETPLEIAIHKYVSVILRGYVAAPDDMKAWIFTYGLNQERDALTAQVVHDILLEEGLIHGK